VIELRLRLELYPVEAVREAARAYAEHAEVEVEERDALTLVRVSALAGADEQTLADELANYVLGLTIERRAAS
jgi:transaldolase